MNIETASAPGAIPSSVQPTDDGMSESLDMFLGSNSGFGDSFDSGQASAAPSDPANGGGVAGAQPNAGEQGAGGAQPAAAPAPAPNPVQGETAPLDPFALPQQAPAPATPAQATPAPQANGGSAQVAPSAPANDGMQPQGEQVAISPEDLVALLTGTAPAPTDPAPQGSPAAAAPAQSAPAQASPQSGEQWDPPVELGSLNIPQPLMAALFESEDPAARSRALGDIIAQAVNASVQIAEERFQQRLAPRMVQDFEMRSTAAQQAREVHNAFYTANPDLRGQEALVKRAGELYAAKNPNAQWTPQTQAAIATLARGVLKQFGVAQQAPAPASSAPSAPVAPVAPAPVHTPYMAGGARPETVNVPEDPNSPGAMLDAFRASGFG